MRLSWNSAIVSRKAPRCRRRGVGRDGRDTTVPIDARADETMVLVDTIGYLTARSTLSTRQVSSLSAHARHEPTADRIV